jgi:hypothetical protein
MTVDVEASPLMAGNRFLTGGAKIPTDRAHDTIRGLVDEAARGELKIMINRTSLCPKPLPPMLVSQAERRRGSP